MFEKGGEAHEALRNDIDKVQNKGGWVGPAQEEEDSQG